MTAESELQPTPRPTVSMARMAGVVGIAWGFAFIAVHVYLIGQQFRLPHEIIFFNYSIRYWNSPDRVWTSGPLTVWIWVLIGIWMATFTLGLIFGRFLWVIIGFIVSVVAGNLFASYASTCFFELDQLHPVRPGWSELPLQLTFMVVGQWLPSVSVFVAMIALFAWRRRQEKLPEGVAERLAANDAFSQSHRSNKE